ncbi:MAG: hypothetical protein PHQ80_01120 [Candidatus ainarchaeum sp.]|nr:hypothetical protein [Candidatus ainarchaeum sp.]MDD5095968.1 hypothetical protein [Candidatus ainarchaeum sp.]
MVEKPSWKQILIELVMTEKLDPWNIDLVTVADSFYSHVKKMEKFDFRIPANIILACAILLKYKSNAIRLYDEPVVAEGEMPVEVGEEPIQPLTLSWRIPPKRQITLQELVDEMERTIKYDTMERPKKVAAPLPMLDLKLDNYDLEGEMVRLMGRMKAGADMEGIVLFSSLVNGGGSEGVISTITPLLHLAQRKSILLRQDKFFGEIFINLGESGEHDGDGKAGDGKEGNGHGGNAQAAPGLQHPVS